MHYISCDLQSIRHNCNIYNNQYRQQHTTIITTLSTNESNSDQTANIEESFINRMRCNYL